MGDQSGSEFPVLMDEVRSLRERVDTVRARVAEAHADWLKGYDARITLLSTASNVLRATELSLFHLETHLSDPGWWRAYKGTTPSIKDVSFDFVAYSQNAKDSLLHFVFGAIENGYRLILRALDPTACDNSTAEFKSIYECLLRTKLRADTDEIILLDLARLLRNTVHNQGVHMPRGGKPTQLTYRGRIVRFDVGQPIEFATRAFVVQLATDLCDQAIRVIDHPLVSSCAQVIADPGVWPYWGDV